MTVACFAATARDDARSRRSPGGKFALVPQDLVIFSGSIAESIRFFRLPAGGLARPGVRRPRPRRSGGTLLHRAPPPEATRHIARASGGSDPLKSVNASASLLRARSAKKMAPAPAA